MLRLLWSKELKAGLYTWKSLAWLLVTSLIFSVTSYLMLTNRELSLLDQTEMLWLLSKVILSAALLVVVIDSSSLITSEFEQETIECLFLAPLTLKDFVLGKLAVSFTLWALVYLVAAPYVIVTSAGSQLTCAMLGYTALYGSLTVLGFTLLVFAVSFFYRSLRNTLTTSLTVLLASSISALFSSGLKRSAFARALGSINPLDNVFASLDNVLVDYQVSLGRNLSFLLPLVGFCAVMFGFLLLALRAFSRKGITKD